MQYRSFLILTPQPISFGYEVKKRFLDFSISREFLRLVSRTTMHRSIHLRASCPIELLLLDRHSVFPQTKCASCRQPGCSNECISLKQGYCSSFNIYLSDLSWLSAHCAAEHRTPIFLHIHTRQTGWQMTPLIMRYSSIQFDKKRNDAICKPSQLGWGNPTGNKGQG